MSDKKESKSKGSDQTVKVAEKKVQAPRKKQDSFLSYVMAPKRCFGGNLSETNPILGPLAIHALFLREGREDDVKRNPHPDGKPYPPYFILSHETCTQRLACMTKHQKSHDQTQKAVDGWPKDQTEVRPLSEVLVELGLS
jgi:hypothetical protein